MRRQAQGHRVSLVSLSAVVATGAAALVVSGCMRSRPQPGLLGPRMVVPAPYVEPASVAPVAVVPPEPAVQPATVLPPGEALDENVIQLPPEPEEKAPAAVEREAPRKVESTRLSYTVKKGDSLWLIGQMYGVSVAELAAENDLSPSKVLKVGQVLKLPRGARLRDVSEIKRATQKRHAAPAPAPKAKTSGSTKAAAASARPATSGTARRTVAKEPIPADGMYTIKSGDNPWDVARKFGVKHEDLMQWNNLKSDTVLQIGQKLRLRSGAAEAASGVLPAAPAAAAVPTAVPAVGAVLPEATTLPAPVTTAPATGVPAAEAPATGAPAAPAGETTPPAGTPAPATGTAEAAATTGAAAAPAVTPGVIDLPKKLQHTVTDGETLQIIAEMYGTTVDAIKKENPTIKGDADLQPNLKLMVPYR